MGSYDDDDDDDGDDKDYGILLEDILLCDNKISNTQGGF